MAVRTARRWRYDVTGEKISTDSRAAFLADFAALSSIGATAGGGVDRQAGTAENGLTRKWLGAWLTSRGFELSIDPIGNLFGTFTLVPGAPYVLAGSHLDSQPLA